MTKPIARDPIYCKRAFEAEIIELCVRWYITYRLSYRDLVEMRAERGVTVAHSTILRWVTRYVPEFQKRWQRLARTVGTSWRVDETCIKIKAKWHFLYRAVDKHGKSVDCLLRRDRAWTLITGDRRLPQMAQLDLERKALENKVLERQIELLEKSQEYRCCPVGEAEDEED